MLVLLPPSEGKAAPEKGAPVEFAALAYAAELTESRQKLLAALTALGRAPAARALRALALSKGQAGEIAVDATLATAPAAPAGAVYTGVLFDRLRLVDLPTSAGERVLIASALWGVLRPSDRIPYYRFSAKARLARIGPPSAFWRPALQSALATEDEEGRLIVDMRSGAYASAWKPQHAELLAVRAFTEAGGKRKTVSHMAKAVRGEVARALLEAKRSPTTPEVAAGVAEAAGFRVELSPGNLDVIVAG